MIYQVITRTVYGNPETSYRLVNDDGTTIHFYEEAIEYKNYQKWLELGNTPESVEL